MAYFARIAVVTLVVTTLYAPAAAMPVGAPAASRALALCSEADRRPQEERQDLLALGLELAEQAVAANEDDPAAHFAVFCNLGKRVESEGVGFSSLGSVYRLKREIDQTLAKAPEDPDALVAKAAMLLRLPRVLGGNPDEGRRLLDQALRIAPSHPVATAVRRATEE